MDGLRDLQLFRRGGGLGTPLGGRSGDRAAVELVTGRGDVQLVGGRANLAQSIVNRLLTRQGELSDLGHPNYGSRLYLLIGEPNTRRTHARAEFYVRESLAAERRIADVVAVTVTADRTRAEARGTMEIQVVAIERDG
jgi:phage baseplate assembly protein W